MAIAALFPLLRWRGLPQDTMMDLLPSLATNLGDGVDTSSRHLALACLQMVFAQQRDASDALDRDTVHKIYHELVQCLEDDDHYIRLSTCKALVTFLQCASPESLVGTTALEYMVEQLLIHMDDPDKNVGKACYEVLAVAAERSRSQVHKKVAAAYPSFQNRTLCDQLLGILK
mmetsp:Transcript_25585/g.59024  ORF Transcript_25585/g.59024 Transcript_25585/m.59024 type:complete len:173 (-) Transcript_25585:167-685(-)